MKSAYPGNTLAACEPQCADATDLDVVRNRLGEVLNFVQCQGERIDQFSDKLVGGATIAGNAGAAPPRPAPYGMVGQMGQTLDDIMAVLQRTDGVVSKLRSVI